MKLFLCLLALCMAGSGASNPELAEIKTVYLLPMTYSLDQFLAIRLTKGGVLQVVTDPKLADAILSDHIGTGLEDKLKSLYGDTDATKEANKEKEKDKEKDKKKDKHRASFAGNPMPG